MLAVSIEPSPVLDVTGVLAEEIGPLHGLSLGEWRGIAAELDEIAAEIASLRREGRLEVLESPYRKEGLEEATAAYRRINAGKDHFVVVGSGGVTRAGRAIVEACCGRHRNLLESSARGGPRVEFLEHADPDTIRDLLAAVPLERSAFAVMSKTGDTIAAIAQMATVWDRLSQAGLEPKDHLLVLTDADPNPLRDMASSRGVATASVHASIPERFSGLTGFGLLPALAAGIDLAEIVAGAREIDERLRNRSHYENPGLALAAVHFLLERYHGKSIAVMMPYAERLREFANWFCSLWAGSLAKGKTVAGDVRAPAGQTPIAATGPGDHHDMFQLLVEGPNDKVVTTVEVDDRAGDGARGPVLPFLEPAADQELAHMLGAGTGRIRRVERQAAEMVLREASRPVLSIRLPSLDSRAIGQLLHLYHYAAIATAMLYHVNPFDRPGVDDEQRFAEAGLGKAGDENLRARLEAHAADEGRYRIR